MNVLPRQFFTLKVLNESISFIKGRQEGELKGKQETARNLHNMGMDNDFIAKALNISVELVKQWITTASA